MSDNIARILALAAIGAGGGGGGGGALTPIVVYELPTVGEEGTLYLVPRQVTETKNVFDEYIYVNGGWEKIGSTDIDFSDYYTKQEVDAIAATLNSSIGERYLKPSGGIPDTDLSSGVQSDLNKAKTALQTESDPVFTASAAAGITSSDITSWNNKLSSETDPIFSASVASGITNTDITNWNNKQDSPVEMTVEAIYHEGSGYDWYIGVEDVNTILDHLESGEKLALTLFIGDDSWYASGLVYFNRFATSGDDIIEIILPSVSNTTNDTEGVGSWTGALIQDEICILTWQRFQDKEHLVNEITGTGSWVNYPTTEAVYDFTNSNFLSKTNTNSYTPSADYHPATKKYVDDKANNYLAKNNTTTFTPTGDYQPATKKYVDDNAGGGSTTPTIIDASSVYSLSDLPTASETQKTITNTNLINQLESLEDDILDREKGGANLLFKIRGDEIGDYFYLPMHLMRMDKSTDLICFIMGDPLDSRYYTLYGVNSSGSKIWELIWGPDGLESDDNKVIAITDGILQSGVYYPSVKATAQYVDLKVARYATMPNASTKNVGDIVQYTGTTTQNYTHGYFYECVLIGGAKTWQRLDVQPSSSSSYEFFDGTEEEWDELTTQEKKDILFAAVSPTFELTLEEEATLLAVLGDKTGIDTDTELEETLSAFLNIAGENE